jgi:hypothetical protein
MGAQFMYVHVATDGPGDPSDQEISTVAYALNKRSGDLKSGRSTVRPRPWPPRSAALHPGQRVFMILAAPRFNR